MTELSHRIQATIAALQAAVRSGRSRASQDSARRVANHVASTIPMPLPQDMLARLDSDSVDPEMEEVIASIIAELRTHADTATHQSENVVLIVEDDRLTARIYADALAGLEGDVLIAGTAGRAEAVLREHNVSIILLDLVLPDGDGRDVLARLRASPATRAVPIIVITARMDPVTQAECFALGADVLLNKPVDPNVLVSVVAAQLNQAAELRVAGRIDRLTGLPNRAALLDTLERLVPLAKRNRQPLCVAMIDLDFFKAINDRYGHDVGDDVLRTAANTIAGALRVSDLPARWGGEEFCILLPDTAPTGAVRALEKALAALRQVTFEGNGEAFSVTFSAGVAALQPRGTGEDAIREADRLLYRAKASGRNRIFSPEDEADPPRPRILLVEDDEGVGRVVTALLEREGFDVVRFEDGERALRATEAEHFVLGVIDVNVPIIDGYNLIARLRALPASAKMPVLMLTGSADEEDIVRGFEVGANDYVTKPFLPRELAARINRLVPRR